MKKILVLLFLFMAFWGHAQSGISYQAVLMSPTAGQLPGADNPKSPLVNATICLRFSISPSVGGTPEYQETITASTDGFGMVNVVIGAVNPSGFAAISWGTGTKYLKVELDHTGSCNGSNTFSGVSEQPFTTVPFALYALNSGSGGGGGSTTTTLTGDVSGSATTGSITTTITNNAITTDKIANSSVTNAKLQNSSITINGNTVPLGGTATIAVTADANTLTGTTLASNVLNSNLTTVGTLNNLSVTNPIVGSITGNAATVTTNADLSGDVKSIGNTTTIEPNAVTSSKILDGTIAVDDLGPNAVTTVKLANDAVTSAKILDGTIAVDDLGANSVNTIKLANDAVETAKIKDAAVTTAKILDGTILVDDLADASVETAKIKDLNVTTGKLAASAVTYAKIQNVSDTNKVLGRVSPNAGVVEEIATIGSGDVVRANSPTLTGITTVNGNLNTSLNSTIGGTLGVTGATTIGGATKINSFQESISPITGALIVNGGVYIAKKLNIGGTTSAVDINASGTLGVIGNFAVDTNKFAVDATNGNTTVAGTLNAGASTLASAIVSGTLNAGSIQNTPIGSTTASTGAFTTLASSSNAIIGGTLDVTNATSLNGNLAVRDGGIDKFTINSLNGNTTVAGTLNAGTSTLNSAVVTNDASVGGDLNITGTTTAADINASGTLGVTGATTLASAVVTGNTTIGGTTKINSVQEYVSATTGALIVDGGVGIAKNLNVGGKIIVKEIVDSTPVSNRIKTDGTDLNPLIINAMSGRFKISGAQTVTVQNSYVTDKSIIICTPTNNASGYSIYSVNAAAGSFSVFFNFTNVTCEINFLVINNL